MMNNIAECRATLHLTQQDLALQVGVSRQTIISIERGRFDPSLPLAFALAARFHCTIEELFTPADGTR